MWAGCSTPPSGGPSSRLRSPTMQCLLDSLRWKVVEKEPALWSGIAVWALLSSKDWKTLKPVCGRDDVPKNQQVPQGKQWRWYIFDEMAVYPRPVGRFILITWYDHVQCPHPNKGLWGSVEQFRSAGHHPTTWDPPHSRCSKNRTWTMTGVEVVSGCF